MSRTRFFLVRAGPDFGAFVICIKKKKKVSEVFAPKIVGQHAITLIIYLFFLKFSQNCTGGKKAAWCKSKSCA